MTGGPADIVRTAGERAVDGRLAASRARIDTVSEAVAAWLTERGDADKLAQYATQLDTIGKVLRRCTTAVAATVPCASEDLAAAYEACRTADRRTVWVERVWRFFAERFDQRDAAGTRGLCVRAADEMVWSCWRSCFATGPSDGRPPPPGPVPLPHLDAVHAPEAFPASLVPADLGAAHADAPFVREHLRALPVPTVRVPAAAVDEPWQLALLAHETGHHLQFAADLVAPFREAVAAAVAGADGDTAAVERWSGWSVEVFADLASVAMLGPWALWPIAELELRASSAMAAPRGAYPPGALRLRLLECAIREAGLDPAPAWPVGSGPPAVDDLPDAGFVDDVVKAGLRVGPPGFTLLDWIGLRTDEFGPVGECEQWRAWFGDGPQPDTHASLRAPRLVIAGALAATADARGAPPAERAALLKAVRERARPA